jgi:hypothetical protein
MALASVRFGGALDTDLAIRTNEQRIFKIFVEENVW